GAGAGAVGRDERAALPGPGQPARARLADRAPGRSGRAYRRVLGDAPAERRVAAQAAGGDGAVVEGGGGGARGEPARRRGVPFRSALAAAAAPELPGSAGLR